MPRLPKLNDLQMILLSTASARADGSFFPLAECIVEAGERARAAVPALVKNALAQELPTRAKAQVWRQVDNEHVGLFITDAGRTFVDGATADISADEPDLRPAASQASQARSGSKTEAVVALLSDLNGATSTQLIGATGWLPHTLRAALTGLRKKGHLIERSKREGETCYRITRLA